MPRPKKWGEFEESFGAWIVLEALRVDISELINEVFTWRCKLSGSNLETTQKYEQLGEVLKHLSAAQYTINEVGKWDLDGLGLSEERVTFKEIRKKALSRNDRLENIRRRLAALALLFHGDLQGTNEFNHIKDSFYHLQGQEIPGMF